MVLCDFHEEWSYCRTSRYLISTDDHSGLLKYCIVLARRVRGLSTCDAKKRTTESFLREDVRHLPCFPQHPLLFCPVPLPPLNVLLSDPVSLLACLAENAYDELSDAETLVICRYRVGDDARIDVGVDDGNSGYALLCGLSDGVDVGLWVEHDDDVWLEVKACELKSGHVHIARAAGIGRKLVDITFHTGAHSSRQQPAGICEHPWHPSLLCDVEAVRAHAPGSSDDRWRHIWISANNEDDAVIDDNVADDFAGATEGGKSGMLHVDLGDAVSCTVDPRLPCGGHAAQGVSYVRRCSEKVGHCDTSCRGGRCAGVRRVPRRGARLGGAKLGEVFEVEGAAPSKCLFLQLGLKSGDCRGRA